MAKAKRATIQLGSIELDVFQLPDGSYRMSQSEIASVVELQATYVLRFLSSKWLKALPSKDYTDYDFGKIEVESEVGRGQTRITPIPLEIAALFWSYQLWQRNKAAIPLVSACLSETLTRRADRAFGIDRSETEYNAQTADLMGILREKTLALETLSESYAADDVARDNEAAAWNEVQRLRAWFERQGIDYPAEE